MSINSYENLDVYQRSYKASIVLIKDILPRLPNEERFDLTDQLRRSGKAIPRLIAEGYGKKNQQRGFQKYLDDALTECNETIVGLNQCKDLYGNYVDKEKIDNLIKEYNIIGKQIYRLREAWFNKTKPQPKSRPTSNPNPKPK